MHITCWFFQLIMFNICWYHYFTVLYTVRKGNNNSMNVKKNISRNYKQCKSFSICMSLRETTPALVWAESWVFLYGNRIFDGKRDFQQKLRALENKAGHLLINYLLVCCFNCKQYDFYSYPHNPLIPTYININ